MANLNDQNLNPRSFSDFPEDVQLCILSFLTPSEVSAFACTSKSSLCICRNDAKLWFALCDRRWSSKTQINKWGNGKVTYRQLYKILSEYENLIGFWRRCGQGKATGASSQPPLVFFEWGPWFVTGSRVSPSITGGYQVIKAPFLWLSIMPDGAPVSFLDPDCRFELSGDLVESGELGFLENELVPVNVCFMGKCHVVVEENSSFSYLNSIGVKKVELISELGVVESESGSEGSFPDRLVSEIYQYFANRMSPGGDRASRRQKRREKERQGWRKWEPEHFVKIVNWLPTPARPLQGLWKGIGDDMSLCFYLVSYDDIGGIVCRSVGDLSKPFSGYSPVFWTSNTTFIKPPFSPEDQYIYDSRIHLRPITSSDSKPRKENEEISRILDINSSYDLVIPDLEVSANPRQVEGRIWQYADGTFGFGFLRNNYIIDLKRIAEEGCILDTMEASCD